MTTTDTCPCNGCVAPKRYPGCHSQCQEYIEWSALRRQELDNMHTAKRIEDDCFPNRYRNGSIMKRRR